MNYRQSNRLARVYNDFEPSPDAIDPADLVSPFEAAEQTGIPYQRVRYLVDILNLGRHFGKRIYLSRNDIARLRGGR